jgi:hypothetical protein
MLNGAGEDAADVAEQIVARSPALRSPSQAAVSSGGSAT